MASLSREQEEEIKVRRAGRLPAGSVGTGLARVCLTDGAIGPSRGGMRAQKAFADYDQVGSSIGAWGRQQRAMYSLARAHRPCAAATDLSEL